MVTARDFTKVLAVVALLSTPVAGQNCTPDWLPGYGVPGVEDCGVLGLVSWDMDGAGPLPSSLIVGGCFGTVGGQPIRSLVLWDGAEWSPITETIDGDVNAMTLWDPDGEGPLPVNLVVVGTFIKINGITMNRVARWDGQKTWSPLGVGFNDKMLSVCVWDPDGPGPSASLLVAGGSALFSGTASVTRIARWDGVAWQPLAAGMDAEVHSLTTWDPDGPGPISDVLVAGGNFHSPGGVTAHYIAAWNGAVWSPLGTGMGPNLSGGSTVYIVSTWDPDGGGPAPRALCAGGNFTTAGGNAAQHIASWDGVSWQPIGSGFDDVVGVIHEWDADGPGPAPSTLIAGGAFLAAGVHPARRIAQWDGAEWTEVAPGVSAAVLALCTWDPDGIGSAPGLLVVGGSFEQLILGARLNRIASWDGATWAPLGLGINRQVWELAPFDTDGPGPNPEMLAAIGQLDAAGGLILRHLGVWDGENWSAAGSPNLANNNWIHAAIGWMAPNATGELVIGGDFSTFAGADANRVARWNGASWDVMGAGVNNSVSCFAVWDADGSGSTPPHVIAGGHFTTAGGVGANRVARWDGSAWHPLGGGVGGEARTMTTWDADGAGPGSDLLIVGGVFASASGVTVNRVASWNGSQWSALGLGVQGQSVDALAAFDPDGGGPAPPELIAGGTFFIAGGLPASRIARWDGSTWSTLGSGMSSSGQIAVRALRVFDSGSGPSVFAGGVFSGAGGVPVNGIARWDGTQWHPLGLGIDAGYVDTLAVFKSMLVVGGSFLRAGGAPSAYFALWGCPSPPLPCYPDCNGNGGLSVADFGCFQNKFVIGDPYADCTGSGGLTIADFACFQTKFVAGCP